MVKWPVQAGAVNETDIDEELVADADTPVGAPGTVENVTELDAELQGLNPLAFCALTLNVYEQFEFNPDTVIGDEAPVPV